MRGGLDGVFEAESLEASYLNRNLIGMNAERNILNLTSGIRGSLSVGLTSPTNYGLTTVPDNPRPSLVRREDFLDFSERRRLASIEDSLEMLHYDHIISL